MKGRTGDASLVNGVLQMHQRWSSQVFVYFTTVVLATGTALILDLRFHWPTERVLLYVLPLTVILLVAVPTLLVVDWKREQDPKPRAHNRNSLTVLDNWTSMMNPARTLMKEFVRRSPTTVLVTGIAISLVDSAALCAAAATEGVLRISQGIGLLENYAFYSTMVGNAVLPYVAKKYYERVCSIKMSKAVVNIEPINKSMARLTDMIKLRGGYRFCIYLLMTTGALFWLSNVAFFIFGNPEIRWGHKVFDSLDHPLTFSVSRLHNLYSWLIVLPLVGHVVIYSSLQLKRAIAVASRAGALEYDLLNPDRRGGFGFLRRAQFAFSILTALLYLQFFLIGLNRPWNSETVIAYILFTVLVIWINGTLFGDIYAEIKKLKFESLDRIKDNVFKNDKLSFEILKYCYETRINWYLIVSIIIQAAGIILAGIGTVGTILQKR